MKSRESFRRIRHLPWLPELAAFLGWIFFIFRVWQNTHTRESVLDEGAYLLKGYLFSSGQYTPFQDGGPWTNQMPLAFLIPGLVQVVFGPGLRTGRYFAVFLAALMLLGLWILARRLGKWWGAAVVWAFAWNPAFTKMYSLAVSQPLVACMLVWALVFGLGKERRKWQIIVSGILAGGLMLTRINMTPVLALLVLYLWWEHGWQTGVLTALAGGVTVIAGHLPYWPEILQMWAAWIPSSLTPAWDYWRVPEGLQRIWSPDTSLEARLLSFFVAWRFHFIALTAAAVSLLLWPPRNSWPDDSRFRSATFLAALFGMLYLAHFWVTILGEHCVFCLESYLAFFSMLGLLLAATTMLAWRKTQPWWAQALALMILVILCSGLAFSTFNETAEPLLDIRLRTAWLNLPSVKSETLSLAKYLTIRWEMESALQRRLAPTAVGAGVGVLISILSCTLWLMARRWRRTRPKLIIPSPAYMALTTFLLLGLLLTPSSLVGGGKTAYDCGSETISSYEAAGADLAARIPPGSIVYWRGGKSIAPLLYVPGIQIFPQQMEGDYSYYFGGDPQVLLRLGLMNDVLDAQWLQEADFVLVEERLFKRFLETAPNLTGFDEIASTPPTVACYPGSQIHVFRRVTLP